MLFVPLLLLLFTSFISARMLFMPSLPSPHAFFKQCFEGFKDGLLWATLGMGLCTGKEGRLSDKETREGGGTVFR